MPRGVAPSALQLYPFCCARASARCPAAARPPPRRGRVNGLRAGELLHSRRCWRAAAALLLAYRVTIHTHTAPRNHTPYMLGARLRYAGSRSCTLAYTWSVKRDGGSRLGWSPGE